MSRPGSIAVVVVLIAAACGDRSPPALWPEPPPPTLAKPIGIDQPVRAATDVATTGETETTAVPAPTSADDPPPPGGEPALTADPAPGERMPMPPLAP